MIAAISTLFACGQARVENFAGDNSTNTAELSEISSSFVEKEYCSITFLQEGVQPIVLRVEKGENLTDIPLPQQKTGYICEWERTDFFQITANFAVRAVERPKQYRITLYAAQGSFENGQKYQQTTVVYGEKYLWKTPRPPNEDYSFSLWKNGELQLPSEGIWLYDLQESEWAATWIVDKWTPNY